MVNINNFSLIQFKSLKLPTNIPSLGPAFHAEYAKFLMKSAWKRMANINFLLFFSFRIAVDEQEKHPRGSLQVRFSKLLWVAYEVLQYAARGTINMTSSRLALQSMEFNVKQRKWDNCQCKLHSHCVRGSRKKCAISADTDTVDNYCQRQKKSLNSYRYTLN